MSENRWTKQTDDDCIYILLTDTGTFFTRLIKAFTGAPYNHASLAFDEELKELYSFGRKRPNRPWLAGFVRENVYEGVYRKFPETGCKVLRLKVTKEQCDQALRFVRDIERHKRLYRYNLLGVIAILLKLDYDPKYAYFCSQFVAEALNRSGLALWERPSFKVTPDDFGSHSGMTTVYEGPLYDCPMLDKHRLRSYQGDKPGAIYIWKRA